MQSWADNDIWFEIMIQRMGLSPKIEIQSFTLRFSLRVAVSQWKGYRNALIGVPNIVFAINAFRYHYEKC